MIVYVNGDSHAAAAEAAVAYGWACDDKQYHELGRQPHPENLKVSFGHGLAEKLGAEFVCQAQAGGSNARTMRTTREWISKNANVLHNTLLVIQWSTWERQEWWHNEQDYQVNASGIDHVPPELQTRYRQFVANINWTQTTIDAHEEILQFHKELQSQNIKHIMFNGNNHFAAIKNQHIWGSSYIHPYDPNMTFDQVLKNNGFCTVNSGSWHFGKDAHCFWTNYLLHYAYTHNLV